MTDCGLKSYFMKSSTALSLSSLVYMLTSKSLEFGSDFRQHPLTEIYELTLQQEVLNESAWDTMAQTSRARADAKLKGNDELTIIYDDIEQQIARLVPEILSESAANQHTIDEIRGQLKGFQQFLSTQLAKAA